MLTKKDEKRIEEIVERSIKAAFEDFYDHIFEPYANQSAIEHREIREEIRKIHENLDDHEERIKKLEVINNL